MWAAQGKFGAARAREPSSLENSPSPPRRWVSSAAPKMDHQRSTARPFDTGAGAGERGLYSMTARWLRRSAMPSSSLLDVVLGLASALLAFGLLGVSILRCATRRVNTRVNTAVNGQCRVTTQSQRQGQHRRPHTQKGVSITNEGRAQ